MGKISQGILGGFAGKVGPVVGSSWKGIAVIKSKPLSVANPRTAAQVLQRTSFAFAVEMAKLLLVAWIKPLTDRFVQRQSGYNAWISRNVGNFNGNGIVDIEAFVESEGSLEAAQDLAGASSFGAADITITWTDNSGVGSALSTDKAYILVIDNNGNILYAQDTNVTRVTETFTIESTQIAQSLAAACYLTFIAVNNSKVSTSSMDAFVGGA